MPVPIFDQPPISEVQQQKEHEDKKEKVSPWVIFFSILLVVVMIILGEFAFRDVNSQLNPYYENCDTAAHLDFSSPTLIRKKAVDETVCDLRSYERTKLILHVDIAAPFIILSVLLFLFIRGRRVSPASKSLLLSSSIFIAWMSLRVVYEIEVFFVKHYPLVGKYFVGITIIALLTALIIIIQRRLRRRTEDLQKKQSVEKK